VPNLILASRITMATVCLRMRKRLDLTVEALILAPEWHELFAEPEREIARKRLADYNYKVATRF
jgi:hypothetical protein